MTLANMEGEESFEASLLGQAEEVVQERICDDELILIKGFVLQLLCVSAVLGAPIILPSSQSVTW